MQSFPYPPGPAGGGGMAPIPPIGMSPSLTQYPTGPLSGYPPQGFPQPQQMPFPFPPQGAAPATYPAAQMPPGFPSPYMRTPGPATLGPNPAAMAGAPGGVPGVSMAPITGVMPPVTTGGPHPLPGMPQVPLPQGFPNPFNVSQVPANPAAAAPTPLPGMTTVTGPAGYLPGIGYFGQPGASGQPMLPGPMGGALPNPAALAASIPQMNQAAPPPAQQQFQPAPQAQAPVMPPRPQGGPAPNPFWLHLAWQLVQSPAVQNALGDAFKELVEGEKRVRTLHLASEALAGPELQNAFKQLTAGALSHIHFTELFADALKAALTAAAVAE